MKLHSKGVIYSKTTLHPYKFIEQNTEIYYLVIQIDTQNPSKIITTTTTI
jgi:hypothetical protein